MTSKIITSNFFFSITMSEKGGKSAFKILTGKPTGKVYENGF